MEFVSDVRTYLKEGDNIVCDKIKNIRLQKFRRYVKSVKVKDEIIIFTIKILEIASNR